MLMIKGPSILLLFLVFQAIFNATAYAKDLRVPLTLDNKFIEQIIKAQIFTGKNSSFRINDDGSGCQFIELSQPTVSTTAGHLKVRSRVKIKIGRRIAQRQCLFLLNWNGYIDLYHQLKIDAGGKRVKVVVVKSEILTARQKKYELGNAIWRKFRTELYPKFQSIIFDLATPIENLKSILPLVVSPQKSSILKQSLSSTIISSVSLKEFGIVVELRSDLPDFVSSVKLANNKLANSKLGKTELETLEERLDAIDAFVTFTLKQFLGRSLSDDSRSALFGILFDVRHEITDILANPKESGSDPVRRLFLNTWENLSPIIRKIAKRNNDQTLALKLFSFVSANDALMAIDKIGPELGLEISVDGLRRLARLLNQNVDVDPIKRDDKVDPQLRKLFGFSDVLIESRELAQHYWFDFVISPAIAATGLPAKLGRKLNNWVPKKHELNKYLPMVKKVLRSVGQTQLRTKKLKKPIRKLYQNLIYAAAWQESCWKQFANIKGFRKPVRSYSGDLGLMQINPRVWRGFYNLHKIKWDIVYNANAGAEILLHYMTRYVIKNKEHIKTGKMENLARATYSGYNGGPSNYMRYRKKNVPKKLKQIDLAFYKKYKAIRDKGAMSVKRCYAGI